MNSRALLLAFVASLALTGCILPDKPSSNSFVSVETKPEFTIYTMKAKEKRHPKMRKINRNLVFLSADTNLDKHFQPMLDSAYGRRNPGLSELSWWQFAPLYRDLYQKVVYIRVAQAKHANLVKALEKMENEKLPYDVIILSHGIPNHLTTGDPSYFMSFRELETLKGKLKKLNLVFMQACFGNTLAKDWIATGAKTVISFPDFNQNFFFVAVFLDHYRYYEAPGAFATATRDLKPELESNKLYKMLLSKALGLTVDDYLSSVGAAQIELAPSPTR